MKKYGLYLSAFILLHTQCREQRSSAPEPAAITRSAIPVTPIPKAVFDSIFDTTWKQQPDSTAFLRFAGRYVDSLGAIEQQVNYPVACLSACNTIDRNFSAIHDTLRRWMHEKFLVPIQRCGNDSIEKQVLLTLGDDLYNAGRYAEAYPYMINWVSHCNKTGYDTRGWKEYIFNRMGNLYMRLGEYKQADFYYRSAYTINLDKKYYDDAAGNMVNISIRLFDLQYHDSAIALLRKMYNDPKVEEVRKSRLQCQLSMHLTATGNFQEAGTALQIARIHLQRLQGGKLATASTDLNEADIFYQYKKGEYTRAIALIKKDSSITGTITRKRETGKALIMLGNCYRALGREDTAMLCYQKALYTVANVDTTDIFAMPLPKEITAENTIMEALDARANLFVHWYKHTAKTIYLEAALNAYTLCFTVERKLMQLFSFDESRLHMLKESRIRSEQAIGICHTLQQSAIPGAWAEKAFAIAEMNKAFVLLESIKRNNAANAILQQDSTYQQIGQLKTELSFVEKTIRENNGTVADTAAVNPLLRRQADLENRIALLQHDFSTTHDTYKKETEREDSFSISRIKEQLSNNTTAIAEYFTGDSATYVFSFTQNSPVQFTKAPPGLAATAQHLLPFFSNASNIGNAPIAYRDSARALFTALGLETVLLPNTSQLLVIPDGQLSFIPFEALVTTNTGNQPGSFTYLVRRCSISYGYSLTSIFRQQTADNATTDTLTAFAPLFSTGQRGLAPLNNTATELEQIRQAKPAGRSFIAREATIGNFRKNAGTSGILHIATHASGDTGNQQRPRIELYDSSLDEVELYAISLKTPLVVLSACETGIGKLEKTEGPMSLARGFYYAGAKNVITSLWRVDDRSTASLFGDFYKGLSGNHYASALRNAKLQYLEKASATGASPYYWAGFIQIGYEKQTSHSQRWLWLTGILAVLLLMELWRRRRKKKYPVLST